MPPIDKQRFLAGVQRRIVPPTVGVSDLNELMAQVRAVLDVTPQTDQVEWDSHLLTATVTSTPQFSIPETAFNEITEYKHVAIQRLDNPASSAGWIMTVSYPGLAVAIRVIGTNTAEANMQDLLASRPALAVSNTNVYGQPIVVYPRGSIIVQRIGDILGGERVRMQYVRVVRGGPASAELQTDLTGGFV